jgi:hypothetical protein
MEGVETNVLKRLVHGNGGRKDVLAECGSCRIDREQVINSRTLGGFSSSMLMSLRLFCDILALSRN